MKRVGIITLTVLAWAGSALGAGSFIVDPSASVEFAPSITTSTNNSIPLINIVAPTAAGISHNKFQKFDVGTEGVIHNNSLTGAQTSILDQGTLSANPNFSTRSATTIIDEITSANASTLEGAIEVYGDSAGVIIANPNGISCNGCSFINAPNSALTTGAVSYGDTGQISIDTSGNDSSISVGEGGLNAAGYGSTTVGSRNQNLSLIARKILLEGTSDSKIWNTERVDLISGSVEYDFSTGSKTGNNPLSSVTEKTPSGATTGAQIDASLVSEVNAGKINIVATENGLGVNLGGTLQATASDVVIRADGYLHVETGGHVNSERDILITTSDSAKTLIESDQSTYKDYRGLFAGRDVIVSADNDFANYNATVMARRTVSVSSAGNLSNNADVAGAAISLVATGQVSNSGSINTTYQSASFTPASGETSKEKVAVGLANAIGKIDGASTTVSGNEIIVTLDAGLSSSFEFDVATTESDGTSSDGQIVSISGSGSTRYVKIYGSAEASDIFDFRVYGDAAITSTGDVVSNSGTVRGYGDLTVVQASTNLPGGTTTIRGSYTVDSDLKSSGDIATWSSFVPNRLKYTGSYAAGSSSTGSYYQPSTVSVSTAALSATYVNTELAEKVVDKDAIIFASDPFVAAQTAATSALVSTASSFVAEDREKEMASIALAEESANAEQELALIETTADLPIISVQQPVGTIQLGSVEQSGGLVGQTTFASNPELISISDTGVVEVVEATDEASDESNDSEGSAVEDE